MAWIEGAGNALDNDLDLRLTSPSGKVYQGNYFTDDDNRDGIVNSLATGCVGTNDCEDCPTLFDDFTPLDDIDESEWSIQRCFRLSCANTLSPASRAAS